MPWIEANQYDPIMNSSQHKKNHEEHNWINTLAEPTDLAELTDLHMKNKGDYLQS